MYARFGLDLMVNHACNLSCRYCYTGKKFNRSMPESVALSALNRAILSIQPGGSLELGFLGGEPLLESTLILRIIAEARRRCEEARINLQFTLTTNGTITTPDAIKVMTDPALDLAISFDGTPDIHDRHRYSAPGMGSACTVLSTIQLLQSASKSFRVITVVRPDTLEEMPRGLRFMQHIGVDIVELNLDLWTLWTDGDLVRLEAAVAESAEAWREGLPNFGVNWFNQKTLEWTGVLQGDAAHCSFGDGEIAVAPSGNLYPCERLIGEDQPTNPMRLPGQATDAGRFERLTPPGMNATASGPSCGLTCKCSNYIRSGHAHSPDRLLKYLDRICMEEVQRVLTPVRVDLVQEETPAYKHSDESSANIKAPSRASDSSA